MYVISDMNYLVSTTSSGAPSSAGGESNWLDFLSGNNPNAAAGGAATSSVGMSSEPPRSSMSWERGHEVTEMFSGTGASAASSGGGGTGGGGGGGGDGGRPGTGRGGGTSPLSGKRSRGVEQGHGEADDGSAQGTSARPNPNRKLKT